MYAKDINALAYMAYDQFENFKQPDEMSIIDYINEFERLNNKIRQFDMVLPTRVLTYKVLNNPNIPSEKKQLIKATVVTLTYENMTKQLKTMYDSSGNSFNSDDNFDIEREPVYYVNKWTIKDQKMDTEVIVVPIVVTEIVVFQISLNNSRSQVQKTMINLGQKRNLLDKSGKVTCFLICKSIYHWANSCPNKVKDTLEDVNITFFEQEMHECYKAKFTGETFNCAVSDSGCCKNMCGESWLSNYLDTLIEVDRLQVSEKESTTSFRFGDENSVKSEKTVTFPAKIGHKNIMIRADVMDTDLPLLLSKSAVKKVNVEIDFSNDTVSMLDQKVNTVFK